ncbi:MAG: putative drug exporter of the superfamily [Gaiellales bacterium]|jgi:RND superfamily putative drug exporter|nr:putative drug exporter of the superfamily [Gaiellales bacterium]
MTPAAEPVAAWPARIAAWIAVHLRLLVVPGLVALAVWSGLHMHAFGSDGTVVNLVPKDAPALQAENDSVRLFGAPAGGDVIVVQRDPEGLSNDAQRRVVDRAVAVTRDHRSAVRLAIPLIDVPNAPASAGDLTTAITHLVFDDSATPADRVAAGHAYLHELNQPGDAPVGITGVTPARLEQGNLILDRLGLIELLTVIAVAVIVAAVFRSLGAALVTLASIGVAFPITLWALTDMVGRSGATLPQEVEPLVVALLLGVVTDYAVFFLSGFRDHVRRGDEPRRAALTAAAEVIPIVFTGGMILSVSLLALRASSLGFFRDLGPALAATVAIAMLVSLLFVPALIALLGRFAIWPTTSPQGDPGRRQRPRLSQRLAHFAAARPPAAVIGLAVVALLVAVGWQLRDIRMGVDVISGLPETSEPQRAARAAEAGFAPGALAPLEVIVQSRSGALPVDGLARLEGDLRRRPGFAGAVGPVEQPADVSTRPFLTSDGRAARVVLVSSSDPLGPRADADLARLRHAMPGLLDRSGLGGATVEYAGQTALAQSAVDAVTRDAVTIAAAVLVVNLLLMMLFMRALVAPIALLAVNALSVAATLGATAWIFQHLLGYPDITYYVPFAGAVLLVSLSSDYNVLIVGRIWRQAGHLPMREAIASEAPRASRAIRAAGLSLAASFALVALIPTRPFRELAAVMVVGILLETFLVRSLLAPALLALLGRAGGWPGRPGWTSEPAMDGPAPELAE